MSCGLRIYQCTTSDMSRNAGNCENSRKILQNLVKLSGENNEFGENGETDEISPRFLAKLKDFMQMSWPNSSNCRIPRHLERNNENFATWFSVKK